VSKVSVMGTFTCRDGKAEEMEAVLAPGWSSPPAASPGSVAALGLDL
jgi:hypothetical protein